VVLIQTWKCDLCGEELENKNTSGRTRIVSIKAASPRGGWAEVLIEDAEKHLCAMCVSSIQHMRPLCGQGFHHKGKPGCDSDHA